MKTQAAPKAHGNSIINNKRKAKVSVLQRALSFKLPLYPHLKTQDVITGVIYSAPHNCQAPRPDPKSTILEFPKITPAGCRQPSIQHTLCRRAELGLIDKCGQIRGLWVILLVRAQVHSHAGPFLAGHCQFLLICCMNHCRYDRRRFWGRQRGGIL